MTGHIAKDAWLAQLPRLSQAIIEQSYANLQALLLVTAFALFREICLTRGHEHAINWLRAAVDGIEDGGLIGALEFLAGPETLAALRKAQKVVTP